MALSSIPIPPDAKRDARARELVPQVKTWSHGALKTPFGSFERGTAFFITPTGHYVNAVFCTCPDYQMNGAICKHVRAVVILDAQQQDKPSKRYEDLYPTCQKPGCKNDVEIGSHSCGLHQLRDAF